MKDYSLILSDTNVMDIHDYSQMLINKIGVQPNIAELMVEHVNKQGFVKVFTGTKEECVELANKLPLIMLSVRLEHNGIQTFILEKETSINDDTSMIEIVAEYNPAINDPVYLNILTKFCEHNKESAEHILSEMKRDGESIVFVRDSALAMPIVKVFRFEGITARHSHFLMSDEEKGTFFS